MLGDAEEWFYRGLGGIGIDHSAHNHPLVLAPQVVGGLLWADTAFDSTWGRIESKWHKAGDTITYSFSIPVNTTATVRLQTADAENVLVKGEACTTPGVTATTKTAGGIELILGSGRYTITAAAPARK